MTDLTAETQTAHDAGERSRPRLGFLAMNPNSFGVDVAKFFPGVPTNEIYHFTMINGDFREEPQTGEPISFPLTALSGAVMGSFDVMAITGGVLLFPTDWHKCLMIMALNLVRPGGKLVLSIRGSAVMTMAQGLPVSLVESWLGLRSEPYAPGQICFTVPGPQPLPRSTLSWMAERGPNYLRRTLGENSAPPLLILRSEAEQ